MKYLIKQTGELFDDLSTCLDEAQIMVTRFGYPEVEIMVGIGHSWKLSDIVTKG